MQLRVAPSATSSEKPSVVTLGCSCGFESDISNHEKCWKCCSDKLPLFQPPITQNRFLTVSCLAAVSGNKSYWDVISVSFALEVETHWFPPLNFWLRLDVLQDPFFFSLHDLFNWGSNQSILASDHDGGADSKTIRSSAALRDFVHKNVKQNQ